MILIGLGANLSSAEGHSPAENLKEAIALLESRPVEILQLSPFYESEPVPNDGSPWYVNAVAELSTGLSPKDLLAALLEIEARMGRVRTTQNAPRIIDLDLLAYGSVTLTGELLILPHPRMLERRFVLAPLADIAPDWRHPVTDQTASYHLEQMDPAQNVRRLDG